MDDAVKDYLKTKKKKGYILVILSVLLMIIAFIALFIGSYDRSFKEAFTVLMGLKEDDTFKHIVYQIRLPRILAGLVAGAALSVSGCVMQVSLKNPLASPSTLGISAASVFGANLAIITLYNRLPYDFVNMFLVPIASFVFALLAMTLILVMSQLKQFSTASIILAGVAVSALFTAFTTIIQYFADDMELAKAVFWTFGDLSKITYQGVIVLSVLTLVTMVYFMMQAKNYNVMLYDDDLAKSLGVPTKRVRLISLMLATVVTAACVSFLGMIAFVGLLGPHIMRKLVGAEHHALLIGSMLMGALILMGSDLIARVIIAPIILPVGAITSLLGAVLFLAIVLLRKEQFND